MFTGIIEETGIVRHIRALKDGRRLLIEAQNVLRDCKVDDSLAVNGICLTVVRIEADAFWVEAVGDTMRKTTVSRWQTGTVVNLERALRLSDRLGGHLVQGHVSGLGFIRTLQPVGENYRLEVEIPRPLMRYVITEGSVAVDGISLTVAEISGNRLRISLIPHTYKQTNIRYRRVGDAVNIEVDVIAKYVERLLTFDSPEKKEHQLTQEWLRKMGF